MRIVGLLSVGFLLLAGASFAQGPGTSYQPVGTMVDIMIGMIHPASNRILLHINGGEPASEAEWTAVQRSAVLLAESGNVLMLRNSGNEWAQASRALVDVGNAAYTAAAAKDMAALSALSGRLDASCFGCHERFRPDVHPAVQ